MSEPIRPLLGLAEAQEDELCGPDGCMIPTNHPINGTHEEESTTA